MADTTNKRTAAFAESAREKSLELRDDAQETYDDMKEASKRRGNDVRHQTTEIVEGIKVETDKSFTKAGEHIELATERIKKEARDGKQTIEDRVSGEGTAGRNSGSKMVEQTTKKLEGQDGSVTIKRTKTSTRANKRRSR